MLKQIREYERWWRLTRLSYAVERVLIIKTWQVWSLDAAFDYLTSCVRVQTFVSPVYMYDVAVVDLSFLHGLIRLTCAYTQCKNVYLQKYGVMLTDSGYLTDLAFIFYHPPLIHESKPLTSNMFFQPLVLPFSSGSEWAKPALLMHTSTPPCWALMAANMARISSSLLRSHLNGTRTPLWPWCLHSVDSF